MSDNQNGHRQGEKKCNGHKQNRKDRRVAAAHERHRLGQLKKSGRYVHELHHRQ